MKHLVVLTAILSFSFFSMNAEETRPVPSQEGVAFPLWPEGKIPGTVSTLPDEPPAGTDRRKVDGIKNVSIPDMIFYRAPNQTGPVPAVIVCPGGGYGHLAYRKEGTEVAAWLNSIGVSAFVLKYRVPGNRDGAFDDIRRAVRLARFHAAELGIDPAKLGVMGFSAGGHLCARLSTNFQESTYTPPDEMDRESCRPDFVILVYPAYLNKGEEVAPELKITAQVPPTLIIHNDEDTGYVKGSKIYAPALAAAGVKYEFQDYPDGGHGHGLRSGKSVKVWPDDCKAWLVRIGVLKG